MKKLLLSSVAMAGASALATGALAMPIQSMSEEGTPILTAGMAAQFEGGFASNDEKLEMNSRNGGFVNGRFAEVYFDGEMTADNGLVYGGKIHMNTSDRSQYTTGGYPGRQYIYLKGDWGSMEFGNWIGADSGLNLCPLACTYKGFGGLDTPYHSYILKPTGVNWPGQQGNAARHINPFWFNQSPKATYYTPVINGFQAGISYTPTDNDFFAPPPPPTSEMDGKQKDIIGLGAQWNGDFGGTTVGFSAVGAISDGAMTAAVPAKFEKTRMTAAEIAKLKPLTEDQKKSGMTRSTSGVGDGRGDVVTYTPMTPSKQLEGLGYYELTGKIGFGGVVVAGTWWDFGDGNAPQGSDGEWTGWALDASYVFGPYGLEVQYAHAERSLARMSDEFNGWNVSLGYSIAPGLKWYGEVTQGSFDVMGTESPDGEYTGTVFLSGLYLNF